MKKALVCFALAFAVIAPGVAYCMPDAGIPAPPADPTQPPAPVADTPSSHLHDPTTDPVGSWSDVKAAKKVGWTALVFALATMLAIGIGTLGKSVKQLAWLAKGRWAVVVGGVAAVGAACYDVAMGGGSLVALAMGAWSAFLAYWNSHREAA